MTQHQNQEGTFSSLLSLNRPFPSFFEGSCAPHSDQRRHVVVFPEAVRKGERERSQEGLKPHLSCLFSSTERRERGWERKTMVPSLVSLTLHGLMRPLGGSLTGVCVCVCARAHVCLLYPKHMGQSVPPWHH